MSLLLSYLLVLNILTFVVYGLDKRSARKRGQRVPENVLLFLAGVGGTPAAYAARTYFRHKTIKRPFITRLRLILIVQLAVVLLALLFAFRGQLSLSSACQKDPHRSLFRRIKQSKQSGPVCLLSKLPGTFSCHLDVT